MHVGFTGTRNGMTAPQLDSVRRLITEYIIVGPACWHDGDCIGADDEAHEIAEVLGYYTIGHPPASPAFQARNKFDEMREPKAYLDRDQDIVDECDVLIAAPKQVQETQRSGTWATIRRARTKGIKRYIVFPSGFVKEEVL